MTSATFIDLVNVADRPESDHFLGYGKISITNITLRP